MAGAKICSTIKTYLGAPEFYLAGKSAPMRRTSLEAIFSEASLLTRRVASRGPKRALIENIGSYPQDLLSSENYFEVERLKTCRKKTRVRVLYLARQKAHRGPLAGGPCASQQRVLLSGVRELGVPAPDDHARGLPHGPLRGEVNEFDPLRIGVIARHS